MVSFNVLKGIIIDSVTHKQNLEQYCRSGGILNAYSAINTALTVQQIYSYAQYDSTYHLAINQYGTPHLEQHLWKIYNSISSNVFAYEQYELPGKKQFICQKCGTIKLG